MSGANSISGLGLFYTCDPTGKDRKPPFVHQASANSWQVCVSSGNLIEVIAECAHQTDALILLTAWTPTKNGHSIRLPDDSSYVACNPSFLGKLK